MLFLVYNHRQSYAVQPNDSHKFLGIDFQLDLFTLKQSINHCGSDYIRKCTISYVSFPQFGFSMTGQQRYHMKRTHTQHTYTISVCGSNDISMKNRLAYFCPENKRKTRHKMQMSFVARQLRPMCDAINQKPRENKSVVQNVRRAAKSQLANKKWLCVLCVELCRSNQQSECAISLHQTLPVNMSKPHHAIQQPGCNKCLDHWHAI